MSSPFDSETGAMSSVITPYFTPSLPQETKSKQLKADSKVFIPAYDPTLPREAIVDLLSVSDPDYSEIRALLRSKNYPPFWISSIILSLRRGNGMKRINELRVIRNRRQVDGPTARDVVGKSSKALAPTLFAKGKGNSGALWRIYAPPASPVVKKPETYSHSAFQKWVYGQAALLGRALKRKTQFVTGNHAAQTLFFSVSRFSTDQVIAQMLADANIFVDDYVQISRRPKEYSLADFIPDQPEQPRSLVVDDIVVVDCTQLAALEPAFKRHKPLFRTALSYLARTDIDVPVDVSKLQADIRAKIKLTVVHRQGREICVRIGSTTIHNLEQLQRYRHVFTDNESLFGAVTCYLYKGAQSGLDYNRIQSHLDVVVLYGRVRLDVPFVPPGILRALANPYQLWVEASQVVIQPLDFVESDSDSESSFGLATYAAAIPSLDEVSPFLSSPDGSPRTAVVDPRLYDNDLPFSPHLPDTVNSSLAALPLNDPRREEFMQAYADCLTIEDLIAAMDIITPCRDGYKKGIFARKLSEAAELAQMGVILHAPSPVSSPSFESIFEQLVSMNYQGNTPSIDHHVKVELPENIGDTLVEAVQNVALATGTSLATGYVRPVTQLVALFASLHCAESWGSAISAILQFATGNDFVYRHCSALITRLYKVLESKIFTTHQGEGFVSQWFVTPIKEFFSQEVFAEIWDTLASCSIVSLLQQFAAGVTETILPPLKEFIVHLRLSAFREGAKTVVTSILSCITEFFATVKLCWTLKSFAPLWGSKWNPDVWSKEVESMMTYYPLLTSASSSNPVVLAELSQLRADKLVSEFWTTPILLGPFAARCEYYYAQGVAQRDYFSKNAALSNSISRLLSRLRSFIDQIVLNMNGSMERVRPLGIGFWGQPGTGKTNLMKQVFKALAAVNNFDTTSAGYYQWVPNANFQDGFDHTKWAVLMDDVDQGVAPPAAGIRNHIEEWLALNNNAPYAIEKAAVEMKGKIYASNVVTGICSNYEDFRVSENCRAPDAFWRRMDYHVEVIASEKFDRGAGLLDPAKAALSDTHDMYILKVRKFDASLAGNPDQKFIPMTQAKIYSFSEFMAELQDYFREHIRRERANLARRADTGPICLVCGLDTSRQCAHQVNFEKTAADDAPKIDIEQIVSVQKQGVEIPVAIAALLATASLSYAAHHASFVNDLKAYFERLKVTQWLDDYKKVISEKCSTIPAKVMAECSRIRLEIQRAVAIAYDAKFFLASAAAVTAVVAAAASAVYFTKHYLQGRDNNAVPGILPSNWVRAEQNFVPGLPMPANQATYTKEDLEKSLRESHIMVKGPKYEMHGFIVAHNTFAVPTHVLLTADGTMGELLILTVANRTISMHVTPLCHKTCPSNPELSLIRCGELKGVGGLASKMWEVVDESVQTFDELELWSDVKVYASQQNAMRTYNGSRVLTASAPTENGDCGLAYVARFGKAWKVVGFHYLLMETWGITGAKKSAVAALATRMEFAKLASQMGTTLQGIVPVLKTLHPTETVTTLPFPLKSEVWAAMSHHGAQPYPLGEAHPPLPGSSMKTKVTHSLFYNMAKERFEEKWCGQRDYWSLPDFRGRMIDEKWTSPWTNMFKTQNTAEFDEYVMITALADYLSGIEYLDNEGYSGISEEEAIIGIPYSYVGALNLKTSVGPPYNKGKKSFISIIDHQAFIDPRLAILVDDIESVVSELCIPVVLGLACQKDEALKPRKFPRIFTSLPAALNIAMKKRGAWKSFVRANFSFFESAVGINMTSAECNKIIQHLRSVDAELRRLIEKDAMSLDNSFSGRLWDIIALAIYAISFVIGVSPMECFMLAHSQKHTIHGIKGDLFSYFKNPSGSDWTVEVNGLTMSVGERYVYYRGRPELIDRVWVEQYLARFFIDPVPHREFTFRLYVAMATYGDDVLANSVCDIPANYQQIWRDEIGIIVTDASKSVDMKFKTLEEAQFLKRNFVWDEELKMYIPPLDKKSLARMLLMKKDSTLTSPDHAAVVLTECLKESVYHGEAFFLEVFNFAEIAAKEYELRENPYLLLRPYSYWRLQMHLGAFQTWSLREPVSPPQLQGKLVSYPPPPPMTTPSIVNSGNDPAKNDPAPAASTNLSHDVGQVLSTSNVQANTITQPKYFQTLPQNDITDFLTRLTEIATWSIDDSNTPIVMLSIDPWALFLADPKVVEKINNYTYIRGTIELLFVVAIPGNCYGSYVISALPNGGGTAEGGSGVATALTYQNCMQVDHYARIDAAASDNVIMQLPFLWPYDFAALPSGPTNSWIIYLSCLTPLRTAIQGGLSVGSVKVFARLLPDYELSVPHFQGKHSRAGHLTASSTIQKYAPALAAHVVGHTNGKVGKVADEVANVAEKLEGVPLIGPYAATAAKAAHAVGKVAHMFGFTRENHEQTPMPITNRSVTNVAHVDSLDAGESASFMSVNEISIDGTLVGTVPEDPLSTASFFNRWTLIKRITWMSSRASGYILDSIYVTPSLFSTSTGGTFSTTPAGYFGLPFQYYRGGMEYLVIIPVSKLHRGSVQILWVPFASTITANPTNTTLNMIYDVAADEEKEVHVGYARELPFLNNRIIQDTTLIVPTGATNGQLVFRVINPLTATNAATTYADIIVFARAAKDMEFAVPRTFVNATVSDELVPCDIITEVNYQGALGDEEAHTEMPVELVPPAAAYPMDELLFGERIESIRALFQKPSRLIFEVPEPVPPSPPLIPNVYDFYQLGPRITQSVNIGYPCGWTWQSWFRMCFTGMAASERFKIFPMAGMWLGAEPLSYDLGAAPPTSAEFNCPGTLAPMTYCGPNKGAEFVIPYYGPQKYIVNRYEKAQQANSAGRKNRLWAIPEGEENRIVVYHSFGPDVRVTCFRQIPRVVFGTTSVAKISWFS